MDASVVVPAYNAENTIGACLNSLLGQDFRGEYEIIVVDDGSKDATAESVKGFKGVKLARQANSGPASARNAGAKAAKGKVIVFVDSDCVVDRHWLREMLKPFKDSNVVGVQGRYRTRQREIISRFTQIEIEERYEKMLKSRYTDFLGSYSAAYRADVFRENNGFNTKFPTASGEDPELSYRLAEHGHKMVFNPNAVVWHRHTPSFRGYLKIKFFRAYWRTLLYRLHKEKIVNDSYTPQTLKAQIALFYASVLAAFAGLLFPAAVALSGLLVVLLFASTLPFAFFALKRDLGVGLLSPPIAVLRTVSFGAGLAAGIVKGVAFR